MRREQKFFLGAISMSLLRLPAVLAVAVWLNACASVVEGTTQPIFVTTTPETGAACTVSNAKGEWPLVSPGTVIIKKSESVLKIRCNKPGWQEGTFYASGRISGASLAGNLVPYVGLLNAAVDGSTGAAVTYPGSYTIELKPLVSQTNAAPRSFPDSAPANLSQPH